AEHDLPPVRRAPRGELHQGPRAASAGHQAEGHREGSGDGQGPEGPPDGVPRPDDGELLQRRPGGRDPQLRDQEPRRRQGRELPASVPHGPDSRRGPPEAPVHPQRPRVRPRGADRVSDAGRLVPCALRRTISELVSVLTGSPKTVFTSHPACGLASYMFLENGRDPVPITRFIDVEGLMEDMWILAQ